MKPIRRRRLIFLIFLLMSVLLALTCILLALRQNINLYLTPQQVFNHSPSMAQRFRLGGLVVTGSVHRHAKTLVVTFELTDLQRTIKVYYNGVLPSLFREGQGIVAQGYLNQNGVFVADEVLAKHDNQYRPPGLVAKRKWDQ